MLHVLSVGAERRGQPTRRNHIKHALDLFLAQDLLLVRPDVTDYPPVIVTLDGTSFLSWAPPTNTMTDLILSRGRPSSSAIVSVCL